MNTLRTNIQNLAMLSAVITFASCESHKKVEVKEDGTQFVKVREPHQDTIDKVAEPELKTVSVKGRVVEINRGKDGFTAKLETEPNAFVWVTLSHSNLNDHTQYRDFEVGETVAVTGDSWKNTEGQQQVTVRRIP